MTSPRSAGETDRLSSVASRYVQGMTSIRGRRVRRLLMREFSGAEQVFDVVRTDAVAAVLGVSAHGAALCATDGRGKHVSVVKWLHGSADAVETRFDLLKDSLPALGTERMPVARLRGQGYRPSAPNSTPMHLRACVAAALGVLA